MLSAVLISSHIDPNRANFTKGHELTFSYISETNQIFVKFDMRDVFVTSAILIFSNVE
jgi:hypothetical protein